ncbi:MAG: hypothetical protein IJS69_04815, partial [Selenomonadaceae bacterium]|nr:hypothetical protein [Selenomonadaceae bacterium]
KIGDKLKVKVTEIDDKGRINVSHRALLEGDAPKKPQRSERPIKTFERPRSDNRSSDRPRSDKNSDRPRRESRAIKDFKDLKNRDRDGRRRR